MLADDVQEDRERTEAFSGLCTDTVPCTNSQIPSFHKYLLKAYYVPPTLLGTRDTAVNNTHIYPWDHMHLGERHNKQAEAHRVLDGDNSREKNQRKGM